MLGLWCKDNASEKVFLMLHKLSGLKPQSNISPLDLSRGLHRLMSDGACSQIMGALAGGAFLVAFALYLGASNTSIGIIAALSPLTQVLQIPAILLIERVKRRKLIVVCMAGMSRSLLVLMATLPWLLPEGYRLLAFLSCLGLYYALGTVSGCAWNAWMHDLIPQDIMGRFFGKRLAVATACAALLSLGAGFLVDHGILVMDDDRIVWSTLFACAAVAGLIGVYHLSRVPEPTMVSQPTESIFHLLATPFRDGDFRNLLFFLGTWNFAINLAAPFYTVYMLKSLQLSLAWIMGLSVLSQAINVLFFRIWGALADRFSNKSCLTVAGPLFVIGIAIWPFLTLPEKHVLTLPLLILIHVISGISTAGVTLCSSNIALKSAPKGKAMVFLAGNALVNGIAASVAPILAGLMGDFFANEELSFQINWFSSALNADRFRVSAISIQGMDFIFVLAVLVGIYAGHRLIVVKEEGEVEEKIVITELYNETRHALRNVGNVAGIRHLTYFPYAFVTQSIQHSRKGIRSITKRIKIKPR